MTSRLILTNREISNIRSAVLIGHKGCNTYPALATHSCMNASQKSSAYR